MSVGEFIKEHRNLNNISQRDLAEKSGVSNAEISRIETGKRKKPSPVVLKAFAPNLQVTYEELMKQAGYIDGGIDHQGFSENFYKNEEGIYVSLDKIAKYMYERDSEWFNLANRVSASDLTESEFDIIKAQTEALLEQFLKNKRKMK